MLLKLSNKKVRVTACVVVVVLVAGGIFYGGFRLGTAKKLIVITDSRQILNTDFSLFWDAVDVVKNRYFNIQEVKDEDVFYGAISGAVNSLKDPYTTFFAPSDAKKFEQDLSGSFGGIGAEIGIRNDQLVIISPLKGNQAEAAGLKALDKILKVNDAVTTGLKVDEAVKLIRGEPDTEVRLLIFRDGWQEAKEFKIIRKIVNVPTMDFEMKPGDIAWIRLYNFNANVPSLFYQTALDALLHGAKGIVLDLRNDPGGYLDVAIELGGWFLNRGELVVKERFHSGEERPFLAIGNSALAKLPVVVLVNGGSASASEILAGALRNIRGAKIVGEKTFGKGTVQEVEHLKDGSTIKVSISEWLTPKGGKIDKIGLSPDFEVKMTDEDAKNKKDPQLDKALEVIKSQIGK